MSRLFIILFYLLIFSWLSCRDAFASSVICQDNFSDFQTCLWTKNPSDSTIFNRLLGVFEAKTPVSAGLEKHFLLTAGLYDTDYLFQFHIKGLAGFHKQAVFRWQNKDNYYLVDLKSSLNNRDSWLFLYRIKDNKQELLAQTPFQNQINDWYYIEISALSNKLDIRIFDSSVIYYIDENPLLSGAAGFAADAGAQEETTVWYNFIKVTDLSQTTPVIFIPGLGASWNIPAMLSCNLNPMGKWTLAPYADLYQRLINTFLQNGYTLNTDFYVYAYDWRQSLEQAGKDLKIYLDNIDPNQQFNIVAHSLGGLVTRSYLAQNPNSHRLKKVITLGSPHQGSVLAYPIWEAGEVWTTDQTQKLATSFLINHCRTPLNLSNKDVVHAIAPSLKDILPTFNYLKKQGQNNFLDVKSLKEQNSWLTNNPLPSDFYNTQFITISGNNNDTLDYLEVAAPSISDNILGIWADGKPILTHNTSAGDGTVLQNSSIVHNSVSETLNNTNHGGLIYTDLGIKTVFKYLNQPNITVGSYQPTFQITDINLEIPGLGNTSWKKYTLKIHN